jgi:hypothetical protein
VTARVRPGTKPARIDVALDSSWSGNVATLEVPAGDGRSWTMLTAAVTGARGVHAVWLRFHGQGEDVARLDWFQFE